MIEKTLPFPRGKTMAQGVVTPDDSYFEHLEGRLFEAKDTVHGTGVPVILRVVKNDKGSAITISTDGETFFKYSTTDAKDWGRRISAINNVAGGVAKPIDDFYTEGSDPVSSIPDDDLFYIVEQGPCYAKTEASSVNLSAGDPIASDNAGLVNGAVAAAGETVLGTIDEDCTTTSTAVLVWVKGDVHKAEATE